MGWGKRPTWNNLGIAPFYLSAYIQGGCVHIFVHIYVGNSWNAPLSRGEVGEVFFVFFIPSKDFVEFIFYLVPFILLKKISLYADSFVEGEKKTYPNFLFVFPFFKLSFAFSVHCLLKLVVLKAMHFFFGLNNCILV